MLVIAEKNNEPVMKNNQAHPISTKRFLEANSTLKQMVLHIAIIIIQDVDLL